jgi:hypothetical protein
VATGEERLAGAELAITMPPQSFTLIEAPMATR